MVGNIFGSPFFNTNFKPYSVSFSNHSCISGRRDMNASYSSKDGFIHFRTSECKRTWRTKVYHIDIENAINSMSHTPACRSAPSQLPAPSADLPRRVRRRVMCKPRVQVERGSEREPAREVGRQSEGANEQASKQASEQASKGEKQVPRMIGKPEMPEAYSLCIRLNLLEGPLA